MTSGASDRAVLRDGTTAALRPARTEDLAAVGQLLQDLSPASRRSRFLVSGTPPRDVLTQLIDSERPEERLTLLAARSVDGRERIVAMGNYFRIDERSAEVAFVVADGFHGLGLASHLLVSLAEAARRHGFDAFIAISEPGNHAMLQVFEDSGFHIEHDHQEDTVRIRLALHPSAEADRAVDDRDRIATVASLRPFFRPRSVAVIGASRDPDAVGHRIFAALLQAGFAGPVLPINPGAAEIAGVKAWASLKDAPEKVDLAVLAIPSDRIMAAIDDCAAAGVRALVVISAGFAETGPAGRELERRLVERVRVQGMRMIGPNCLGLCDMTTRLNASFSPIWPPAGRVALASQSGAVGIAAIAAATRSGLGLSSFVSMGNKADVSSNDLLLWWEADPATDAVMLYLESFGNPRRFARICRRVARRKPILALKAGRSRAGIRAAGSHTAALAADDLVVDALFRQAGVVRVDTLAGLLEVAGVLVCQPLPAGRRVAIMTNAGGPGILCADACDSGRLDVVPLDPATRDALTALLPAAASVGNPVDLLASASAEQFEQCAATLLAAREVDALVVVHVPVGGPADAQVVAALARGVTGARTRGATAKPVLFCRLSSDAETRPLAAGAERIPVFAFPEEPARALARVADYADWRRAEVGTVPALDRIDEPAARRHVRAALARSGPGWFTGAEAWSILESFGLPICPRAFAGDADEAAAAATKLGFPVALKLVSRRILHKTEVAGVMLGLADEAAVRAAFGALRARLLAGAQESAMDGVILQPMVQGVELLLGAIRDPVFGPVVAFGLGGVHLEVLRDVQFRITPLTDRDASEQLRAIRGFPLLDGHRGRAPCDLSAIEDCLLRVSRLVETLPGIAELDLNPVMARPPGQGCLVVDVRLRIERMDGHDPASPPDGGVFPEERAGSRGAPAGKPAGSNDAGSPARLRAGDLRGLSR